MSQVLVISFLAEVNSSGFAIEEENELELECLKVQECQVKTYKAENAERKIMVCVVVNFYVTTQFGYDAQLFGQTVVLILL